MPITYTLKLTEWQILFLRWVARECPPGPEADIFNAYPWFIKSVRALADQRFIEWNHTLPGNAPASEIFKITETGKAALTLTQGVLR